MSQLKQKKQIDPSLLKLSLIIYTLLGNQFLNHVHHIDMKYIV